MKEHLSTLRSEVDQAISDRKLQFKKDFEIYTTKLKQITNQEKDYIKKLNDDFESEYQAASSDFIFDNSRLEDKKNVLLEQNEKLTSEYQSTLKQIDSDFKSICLNKGVSAKQLDEAHRNKLTSEKIYQDIIHSENLVYEYKRWLKVNWPKKSAFEDSLNKAKHAKSKLEKEKHEAKRQYESEIEKLNKSKNKIEGLLKESRTALENIKVMQDRLGVFPDNNEEIEDVPLNLVLINANDGLDKKQTLNSDLRSNMNNIESFISRHSDMQIAQGWERDCEELAAKLNKDIYDNYLYLSKQELLERFITKTIPQAQDTLIEQVYSISQELNEFTSGLLEAERHITSQSNLIIQSIDRNQTIHALSDIKIVMESKIKEQEYWEYLHKFQKAWRLLNEKGRGILPDNKFIETLRDTLHVLQQVKIEQNLKSLFDLYILVKDKGKLATIRTDQQLKDASSNGLSYLLLCIIFTGIGRLLCKDTDVNLHWPVDELGIIHGENISLLFKMLDQGGVVMLAGFPSNDPDMLRHFSHRHLIDFKKGISTVEIENDSLLERIKARKEQKQLLEANI